MELNKHNMKKLALLVAFGIILNAGLHQMEPVAAFLRGLLGLVTPFLAGASIAFILNVPMRQVESHLFPEKKTGKIRGRLAKAKRPVSLLVTLLLVTGVLAIIVFMIVPELGRTFQALADQVPVFAQQTQEWAEGLMAQYPQIVDEIRQISIDWESFTEKLLNMLQSSMGSVVNSTIGIASSIIGGVVGAVVAVVFAVYVLLQKERLGRQFRKLLYAFLPEHRADWVSQVGYLSYRTFSRFLSGQCLEAVILGCMFFLTMSILRFPYALVISVLIAVTALIPIFGAFIGCIVGAFLILMVDPMQAVWFVVLFLVLQQVEGNLIYPHVVGSSVGLPSIWVLAAVTVGGSTMGIAGMLLFIPFCSVLYTLLRRSVWQRLRQRNIPPEKLESPEKQGASALEAPPEDPEG